MKKTAWYNSPQFFLGAIAFLIIMFVDTTHDLLSDPYYDKCKEI